MLLLASPLVACSGGADWRSPSGEGAADSFQHARATAEAIHAGRAEGDPSYETLDTHEEALARALFYSEHGAHAVDARVRMVRRGLWYGLIGDSLAEPTPEALSRTYHDPVWIVALQLSSEGAQGYPGAGDARQAGPLIVLDASSGRVKMVGSWTGREWRALSRAPNEELPVALRTPFTIGQPPLATMDVAALAEAPDDHKRALASALALLPPEPDYRGIAARRMSAAAYAQWLDRDLPDELLGADLWVVGLIGQELVTMDELVEWSPAEAPVTASMLPEQGFHVAFGARSMALRSVGAMDSDGWAAPHFDDLIRIDDQD